MQIKWPSSWREQFVSQVSQDAASLREEDRITRELELVADFATNWRAARDLMSQKSLLRIAITRLALRGHSLVEIQLSQGLSQLLLRLHLVDKAEDTSRNPVHRLHNSDSLVDIMLNT